MAKKIDVTAVYDIETEDWDTFVCGGLLLDTGEYQEFDWRNEKEMVEAILAVHGSVFAHNGGRFDHLWFLDCLDRFGFLSKLSVSIVMSGASIVRAEIKGPGVNLTLVDSWRIFPMRLKLLSGGAKDATGMDCEGKGDCADLIAYQRRYGESSEGCGGYCAIRRAMAPVALRRVMDYCRQDCIALMSGLRHMLTFAETLEIDVGYTVGGTAWKTAKAYTGVGNQPLSEADYYYARTGYYGGRVGLFNRYAASGFQYDITSSYPYQCSQPLPSGRSVRIHDKASARAAYQSGLPGIYSCRVIAPVMHIPVLPVRAAINGEPRLCFPTGPFHGTWPLPELQYAESQGYFVEAESALVFREERTVFDGMMQSLIERRLQCGKKSREGEWLKLVANSLYGKLASKPENEGVYLNPSADVVLGSKWPVQRIGGRLGVYIQTRNRISECGHIVWAAYITARGRVQLHRMLTERNGGADALYCDTDSCFSVEQRRNGIGRNLGDWAEEGMFSDFNGIAPKVYRYVRDGKPKLKAKGVTMPGDIDKAWDWIKAGIPVTGGKGRIRGFKSALARVSKDKPGARLFERETVTRLVSEGFGDRIELNDGQSRPPKASELQFVSGEVCDDSES